MYSSSSVAKERTIFIDETASCAIAATIASLSCITAPTERSFDEALSIASAATGIIRDVTSVSRQLRKIRKPMMPTKVTPCTTKSMTADARMF